MVIPTFGDAPHLEAVISALGAQTYSDFQVVVVDNNESQVWTDKLGTAGAPVAVVHEPRNGLQYARNAGVNASGSAYVAFLDDDGVPSPSWLTHLLRGMERYGATAAGGTVVLDLSCTPPPWFGPNERALLSQLVHEEDIPVLGEDMYVVGANMCIRRDAFGSVGLFDLSFDRTATSLRSSGELEFTRRLQAAGKVVAFVAGATVVHRIDAWRLTEQYMLTRSYWQGRSDALLESKWGRPMLFGRRNWRANLIALCTKFGNWLASPNPQSRVVRKCLLAREFGYCAQVAATGFARRKPSRRDVAL